MADMLHPLGTKPKDGRRDLLSRLLDCHARIRETLSLANELASEPRAPDQEIATSAEAVCRYFQLALPMHTRDEEESIAPRLDAVAGASLGRMKGEHRAHEPLVEALVAHCEALRAAPARWAEMRAPLAASVDALSRELLAHLEEEERDIFPLLTTTLDEPARARIVEEMQARRDADKDGRGRDR